MKIVKWLPYVCFGTIAVISNIQVTSWSYWAILACILMADITSVINSETQERNNEEDK